jgi:hypothetical protein
MDPAAQNTSQMPQQQARPVVEPAMRESLSPVQAASQAQPVPQAPSSLPQMISIGREQGPVQISNDDEDDTAGAQQYTPQQAQAPSEIVHQPSPEKIATQAVPQEIAQSTTEMVGPSVPEIEIPKELTGIVNKTSDGQNYTIPVELQNYGVRHTIPQVVVPENKYEIRTLPLPYEEVLAKEKAFQYKDSMKWLSAKVHYYWKKINPLVYK